MTGAAILAIVVATSEINDPATAILIGAAGETLGPEVAIRLLGANQPEESDPLRIERETGAGAVVTLVWRDASRLRARIRLHVAASGHTTTRDLIFSEADTRVERGRTLGLAAASMWPEIHEPALEAARPPPPRPPSSPPAASEPAGSVPAAPSAPDRAVAGRTATPDRPPPPAPVPPAASRFALGLGGVAASDPRAVGARVESLFVVGGSWSLRAAMSGRRGPISTRTLWTFALGGGLEWWPVALRAGRLAWFGARADAMVMRHRVNGAAPSGTDETHDRYLPVFDLLLQMALRTSARLDLLAAVGAEAQAGGTDIRDVRPGQTPVIAASIPPFQLVAEVGLRVGF